MSLSCLQTQFNDKGFLLLRGLIEPEFFQGLLKCVAEAVDKRARRLYEQGKIRDIHRDKPLGTRWQHVYAEMGNYQKRRSWDEDVLTKELFDLMRHPALLNVLETLIGPEIQATGMFALRPKVPHDKRTEVLWHQDSHYLGESTAEQLIVSTWIPLVDTDEKNGCMQVIPSSHTWGLVAASMDPEHLAYRPTDDPSTRGEPCSCKMSVGDVLFFSNLMVHRSLANHSDHTRWSIDLRYHAAGITLENSEKYLPGFRARSRHAPHQEDDWPTWQRRYVASGVHTE